ncbi:NAD(P)-dependent dehydrogenase (short-subunit alcohol dehydrogenase family) [Nocardioides daedukensis]|uniref:NAD(P)-dependent dehydrogenase (Short-subunit alcohol dehydrogenase family) n=1 Tax=Nocardioides daedukensis TaxID=634462 RepID=A0A7Y9RYQ9_9ACTN|nr:NAD(P)-dependent dehydrogenase (short-subunit alcohol dehydrogenase family) [Nocardioides daedukensis]
MGRTPAEIFGLQGRVAIVTGGSSGLGVQFAHTLAAAGADVVLAARRVDKLREVATAVETSTGRRCLTVATDVSRPGDCEALVSQAVDELGDVHVLVNNAGISRTNPAHHEAPEDFTSVLDVNLSGAYYMAQAFARHCMAAGHGGSIVNISSVLAISGTTTPQAGYSASKAGLLGLTRDLALQWSGRKQIRVNALAPGYFESELTRPLLDNPDAAAEITGRTALGRLGESDELSGALLLLASDAGSYITGVTLAVDGGWTLH